MTLLLKNWRTVLGLALVTVLFCCFLYIKGIRAENARLAQANQISEAAIDRLEADLAANRKALETREAESKRLAQDHQAAVDELARLYETDKESCDWASGKLPDGVYKQLCK